MHEVYALRFLTHKHESNTCYWMKQNKKTQQSNSITYAPTSTTSATPEVSPTSYLFNIIVDKADDPLRKQSSRKPRPTF